MIVFESVYSGHRVDSEGESKVCFKCPLTSLGEVSKLPLVMGQTLRLTVEVVDGEDNN